jgi:non-ribosomal peptide synthetase component E (peptide arylation enzyme)/acyl carrier protein
MLSTHHQNAGFRLKAVAIESANSIDFVRQVFRTYELGAVAMVCPPIGNAMEITDGLDIVQRVVPVASHGWCSFSFTSAKSDDPAHISFTSGTTGGPKGIVLSHAALQDVVERLNDAMGLEPDVREYIGVPVNFSFGFGRCRAIAAVGGSCFIPATGFNPMQLSDMLKEGRVNAISAVPTQWRALLQAPSLVGAAGRVVRWIEIGSQFMSRDEKQRLKELFPNATILQHYGLTEASRTTFLDITRTSGGELESVGRPIGKTEVEISADGRVRIRGPHVALGELRDGWIQPIVDTDGWLQTNDLGSLRNGYLYYAGRADDLINCGGTKVPSELFENILLQELDAKAGIAVGPANDALRGQVILVVTDHHCGLRPDQIRTAAHGAAKRFGLADASVVRFAHCDEIPRTPTGKVRRGELARLTDTTPAATNRLEEPAESLPYPADSIRGQLTAVWQDILRTDSVPTNKSFFELGGDSLSALAVMLQIERSNIPTEIARKVFEGKTIQQIVDEVEGREAIVSGGAQAVALGSRVINATRGLLVLHVIMVHWSPWLWERLPANVSSVHDALYPVYRFGTPGFALVFGLGWGYFQVPLYRSNFTRFLAIARRNTLLLFVGILVLGAARAAAILLVPSSDRRGSSDVFVSATYSVLVFYFLMMLASPILLRPLARSLSVVVLSLFLAMLAFAGQILAWLYVSPNQQTGLIELMRLMLVARYNIFVMSGTVFLGVAMGAAYRRAAESDTLSRFPLLGLGLTISGFGLIASYYAGGFSVWMKTTGQEPWAMATYAGIVLSLCGVFQKAFTAIHLLEPVRTVIEALAILGILALPAFVLHEVVIPVKSILVQVGTPTLLALALPVATFVSIITFFYLRLRRVYSTGKTAIV